MKRKHLGCSVLRRFITILAASLFSLLFPQPSALAQSEPDSVLVQRADSILLKANESMQKFDYQTAFRQFTMAVKTVENITDLVSKVRIYLAVAQGNMVVNPNHSLRYLNPALGFSNSLRDTNLLATCYRMLGLDAQNTGYLLTAEDYTLYAAHLDSASHNPNLVRSLCLLGHIYSGLAERQHSDSLARLAIIYLNNTLRQCDSLGINGKTRDAAILGLASAYIGLAEITGNKHFTDTCNLYFTQIKDLPNLDIIAARTVNAVNVRYLIQREKYRQALDLINADSSSYFRSKAGLAEYHRNLYKIYEARGNYSKAFVHLKQYTDIDNEIHGENSVRAVVTSANKKSAAIERLSHEAEVRVFEAERSKMHVINISLLCGLIMVLLLVVFVVRMLQIKRRANSELARKNIELAEQKEEIMTQRDTIKEQSDEIQASINYARRIQRSLLTPEETITRIFPEHFLLYKPRNIVSGDYYWVGQYGDNKVCIVADCTGHGVPGGFMSVLGMTNLNWIVGQNVSPDMILNRLREAIIVNLRQSDDAPTALQDDGEPDSSIDRSCDGMDVAVYVVNEKQMTLTFAGANNPLVLIRDSEIQLLKANKMPVGIYARMNPFENTTIELQKGDCIYTFSDGYQDQFNSDNEHKFTGRRLRELLLEIHQRPMSEQKEILNREYEQWRGPSENQTDDVVIMGVRI
ncbi:MAG: SpoIIE family protein phosphatase [Salinivirgaceae bacterium]|nr:SpoIIE family protein phosphatase [Salinivirgaceae bacterium]